MSVITYNKSTQITKHFNSNEFQCPHCKKVKISKELINKLEEIFNIVEAKKCIISSGYRCDYYDKKENGFLGQHSKGLACDVCYYDKNNKIIPSKIICCIAYDLKIPGISYINKNYTHLDMRKNGTYYGDETRGNSSYWKNPYTYFNVTKEQIEKYTKNNKIKYQVYGNHWYPNVAAGTSEYAGVYGVSIRRVYIDKLKYRVKSNGKWLSEVKGREDYAGYSNKIPITDIAIQNATYRVHIKNGKWLPYVNGYNINDKINGYAGIGKEIDALQIK